VPSGDIVTLLSDEHKETERRLETFAATHPDERGKLFSGLTDALIRHAIAEEMVLYPIVVCMASGGEAIAHARISAQLKVAELISQMEAMDPGGVEFAKAFNRLRAAVCEHARYEETDVFPLLQEHEHEALLVAMGRRYSVVKYAVPPSAGQNTTALAEAIRNVSPGLRIAAGRARQSPRSQHDQAPSRRAVDRRGAVQQADDSAS
jgi:iron-sulfur cluster repair protein YtfE (RIC family)